MVTAPRRGLSLRRFAPPLEQGGDQVIGLREHASQVRELAKRRTIPYENSLQPIHAGVGAGQNLFQFMADQPGIVRVGRPGLLWRGLRHGAAARNRGHLRPKFHRPILICVK